jgi:hypothetical protein
MFLQGLVFKWEFFANGLLKKYSKAIVKPRIDLGGLLIELRGLGCK